MSAGISLTIFTWLTMLVVVCIHPLIRRVTNSYLFWLIYGSICLALFVACRWFWDWNIFVNDAPTSQQDNISRVFCLDVCPFLFLFEHVCLLCSPSRKIPQYCAGLGLLGGLLIISSRVTTDPNAAWSFQYLFLGVNDDFYGFFLTHYLLVLTSTLILCSTPINLFKTVIYQTAIFCIHFIHIALVLIIFYDKVQTNCTGLLKYDWEEGGQFYRVIQLLKINWIACECLGIVVCLCVSGLLVTGIFFIQKIKYWQIPDKKDNNFFFFSYYELKSLKELKNKKGVKQNK